MNQRDFYQGNTEFAGDKATALAKFNKGLAHPVQIHYAGFDKPWNCFRLTRRQDWIKAMKSTPGGMVLYLKSLPRNLLMRTKRYSLKRFLRKTYKRITKQMNFASKIPVLRSFARAYALTKFKKEWRKRNKQNQTVPMNTFPMECVEVGNGTYGELHILSYFPPIEKLTIGNYVSLASNVHFILSGNHQTETLFTYPIRSTLEGKHCQTDSRSKGPIIVVG